MTNPIHRAIDQLFADQNARNADIFVAGEQIRKWCEEEGDCADAHHRHSGSAPSPDGLDHSASVNYRKEGDNQ